MDLKQKYLLPIAARICFQVEQKNNQKCIQQITTKLLFRPIVMVRTLAGWPIILPTTKFYVLYSYCKLVYGAEITTLHERDTNSLIAVVKASIDTKITRLETWAHSSKYVKMLDRTLDSSGRAVEAFSMERDCRDFKETFVVRFGDRFNSHLLSFLIFPAVLAYSFTSSHWYCKQVFDFALWDK